MIYPQAMRVLSIYWVGAYERRNRYLAIPHQWSRGSISPLPLLWSGERFVPRPLPLLSSGINPSPLIHSKEVPVCFLSSAACLRRVRSVPCGGARARFLCVSGWFPLLLLMGYNFLWALTTGLLLAIGCYDPLE